ncbi:DUF982 domain-containing protein [Rhizobium sp. NFACC06-2]|uniref:DUF982 domain-containing protein n=1 Tax=Rhizobium sp. NFACC06-2 TaxID=1566264 RepID=UPI000876F2E2|nr:DUF982 domain-containing protein [Rhizobium sp. NFACC06-2]SCY92316.1 Protein of unknown function [Rhizobium sp. NFACC06-2]
MLSISFDRPLFVRNRHYIQEIGCLDDVFDLFERWPEDMRDVAYETVLRAARASATGNFPVLALRSNLELLIRRNGMQANINDVSSPIIDAVSNGATSE